MRIDSSLSNSYSSARGGVSIAGAADAGKAAEQAVVSRSRSAGGNSTSTLLSASLANALWSIDSARQSGGAKTSSSVSAAADGGDENGMSPTEKVQAHYLEYMDTEDEA
ncbi:hypothetical protein NAC44_19480 [Allorhizobium sp. BGMRC 0089]|uniref:hypothetical protein n=1 Tax=Allorhizobium sonneratiae TaxID=2934936 RepID=UPI0020340BB0|nr:hypothetical protein [Allorhizobium sonneratiae]MCM2294513.1 hypothetical protein [Allorhizobium sonneratiae]